jgi:chromosome segregation ATPase
MQLQVSRSWGGCNRLVILALDQTSTITAARPLHVGREELQEQIAALEVEVAGIAVNNPRVVEEYMKRKAEIEKLAQDLAAQRAELDSLHTEIEQLKVRLFFAFAPCYGGCPCCATHICVCVVG